ncbi:hypothetical protein GCM10009760_01620 [Kitasatospora kazusensis]|uniref:Uncharacterized protein n=1 Tax=Kitasatospora kazusensis TaxID=407974 RepID=A0ABN2YMW4_9ACTN
MDTQLFGAFGSGGLCLAIAVWIILGSRKAEKQGKLAKKHKGEHTAWLMIVFGIFAAGAGQAFSAPGTVGDTLTHALTSQNQAFGNVGAGAVAAILTIVLFGTKPGPWKDSILGSTVPSVYAAAGGIWALPLTVVGSVLKGLVGA